MGRFRTGMKGPDAIQKLNELDDSVSGAIDGAAEAIRQAEAARDDTFTARDVTDGYRAISVAAGLTATEKAAQTAADRLQVAADAQAANDDRIAADAAAEATAQDRAAVAQIVADGTESLGQQLAAGIDQIGTASTTALDGISTARAGALQDLSQASGAALSSISTEVGKATDAADASEQSRAQAATAAGTATGKAEQTTADAQATAADRLATTQARGEAVSAAGTATAKAQQTAGDAEATAADRQATDAARGAAVTAAGTATSKAQATAADAEATASDRAIVLTARGEAIQGATDALAAADTAEGHVEAAAAILASVEAHGNGWTPTVALAVDGERRVLRILSWAGGVGTPPVTGYLAESGVVADPGLAINVRGARGADGEGTGTTNSVNNVPAIEGNVSLQIGDIPGLQEALAAAGQVKTVAGVAPGADGDVPLDAAAVGADPAGTADAAVEQLGEALAPVAYTGDSDDLIEGAANRFFTAERARAAIGEGGATTPTRPAGDNSTALASTEYADRIKTAIYTDLGDRAALTTADKTSIVKAINEVNAKGIPQDAQLTGIPTAPDAFGGGSVNAQIANVKFVNDRLTLRLNQTAGVLANLTTTAKASLVEAVNEVNAKPTGVSVEEAAPGFSFDDLLAETGVFHGTTTSATQPGGGSGSNEYFVKVYVSGDPAGADFVVEQEAVNATTGKVHLRTAAVSFIGYPPITIKKDWTEIGGAGGGAPVLLPANFAFNDLKTAGSFYGMSSSADGPESGSGGPLYTVDVTVYPTGNANGDLIMHVVRTNNGGHYTRYGLTGLNAWDAWNSANVGTSTQGQTLATVVDFNSLTAVGLYRFTNGGMANAPSADSTLLARVSKYANASIVLQEVWAPPGSSVAVPTAHWVRTRSSGVWGAWVSVGSPPKLVSDMSSANAVFENGRTIHLSDGGTFALPALASVADGYTVTLQKAEGSAAGAYATITSPDAASLDPSASASSQKIRIYSGESVQITKLSSSTRWQVAGRAKVVRLGGGTGSSNVAQVAVTSGFDDPELVKIEILADVMSAGTVGAQPAVVFRDANGDAASATYSWSHSTMIGSRGDNAAYGATMGVLGPGLSVANSSRWLSLKLTIPVNYGNITNSTYRVETNYCNTTSDYPTVGDGAGVCSLSIGQLRGVSLRMTTGNISSILRLNVYGYRK